MITPFASVFVVSTTTLARARLRRQSKDFTCSLCLPACGHQRFSMHPSSTRSFASSLITPSSPRLSHVSRTIFCFLGHSVHFCKLPFSPSLHSLRPPRACQCHQLNDVSVCDMLGVLMCLSSAFLFYLLLHRLLHIEGHSVLPPVSVQDVMTLLRFVD